MANLFLVTYGTTMHTYIHMYTVEHMHTAHCTLVSTITHTCIQTRIHTPKKHIHACIPSYKIHVTLVLHQRNIIY